MLNDVHPLTEEVNEYRLAVESLTALHKSKASPETAEQTLLHAFLTRERLAAKIADMEVLTTSVPLNEIYALDQQLYYHARKTAKKLRIPLNKWRYLLPEPDKAGWWWKLDRNPVLRGDSISFDDDLTLPMVSGIALFALAAGVMFLTTQQLWARGLDVLGYVQFGIQALVGGGLITETGQQTALALLSKLMGFSQRWNGDVAQRQGKHFPLIDEARPQGTGVLAAGLVFLTLVVLTALIFLPSMGRLLHQQGVAAIQRNDFATARAYLDLAVRLQPQFLPIDDNSSTVSLTQLGELFYEVGDFEQAQASYEAALENDVENVAVHYRLADLYLRNGEGDRALILLDQAVNLLEAHRRGERRLAVEDETAVVLLYQSRVTRARVYLELYGADASRRDLSEAATLADNNPDLFITSEDSRQPGLLMGTSMLEYLLVLAQMETQRFIAAGCPADQYENLEHFWDDVNRFRINQDRSIERLWRLEATDMRTQIESREVCSS